MEYCPDSEADEEKFADFMEPEGSLPYSQKPAICPNPEPVDSSPTSLKCTLIILA
jgi:hypothetical protein